MKIYCDGALCASTGSTSNFSNESGSSSPVHVFEDPQDANQFYTGKVAGGPLGPFHLEHFTLKAEHVERLYALGRAALGLV